MKNRFPAISLTQRLSLSLLLLTVIVIGAGLVGLWYATEVENNIAASRQAADQAVRLSELQRSWLAAVGILDTLSVTSNNPQVLAQTRQQMQAQLEDLNRQLVALEVSPLGISTEKMAENQAIVANLRQTVDDISQVNAKIFTYIEQNRWGAALQLRQSELSRLQVGLDQNLKQLNDNLQADLSSQRSQVARLSRQIRSYVLVAIAAAVLLAIVTAWLTRRSIMRPLARLNADVRRITTARSADDLADIQPLTQRDELGALSRSFALMAARLRESYQELERRVAERTSDLERRTDQLQVSAQVARDIAAARNLEDLLNRAVNLIRDRFGFYHAGLFLISGIGGLQSESGRPDEAGDESGYAVLQAATGEAGRQMLARGHRLKVGSGDASPRAHEPASSLVGTAAQTGQARVALDTGQDAAHFKNPLLPDTRSEAALPLKIGERVIGVLDVQSRQAGAFDEESLATLQIMADQLAIAIQNAQLLAEVQQNLAELEAAYGRYDQQAWENLRRARQTVGFEYDGASIVPIAAASEPAAAAPLHVPLRVRGQVIGALDVWPQTKASSAEGFSEAEVYLLSSLSNRLSQILESSRLFEEAQMRATREEMINQITASIARSLDTDNILQNAALRLAALPGVAEVSVVLSSELDQGDEHDHRA